MPRILYFIMGLLYNTCLYAQAPITQNKYNTDNERAGTAYRQFMHTSDFLNAAIHSLNSFAVIIKKENYRSRLASINNPASSDMGFNLESEIQAALKPLLAKAKNTSQSKFSAVVSSLLSSQATMPLSRMVATTANPAFFTLMSLVGTLTVQEKKITREDLDSFINATSKYFLQYERLNQANLLFEQQLGQLCIRLKELQFDTKEYILNMIAILYPNLNQADLRNLAIDDLQFTYLDRTKLKSVFFKPHDDALAYHFPTDGISAAKNISYTLQKLFEEYERSYTDNYQQVRTVLMESKTLGRNIDQKRVDASLKEMEYLYKDSQSADMLAMQFSMLAECLKALAGTEQAINDE